MLYALAEEIGRLSYERHELRIERERGAERIAEDGDAPSPQAVVTCCVGVGPRRSEHRAELVLNGRMPVRAIVMVGYAGALSREIQTGSLVVCETAVDRVTKSRLRADERLLSIARRVKLPAARIAEGVIVTTNRVVVRAADKAKLHEETSALAVDMETAGVARVAERYGVPWIAVRAITDGARHDLPIDFNRLADEDGDVDRSRIVRHVLARPWKIPALILLGNHSARASRNLAAFLQQFLAQISA